MPVAVLLALKVGEGDGCSYCAQRQLVIVEPVVAIMLGLGLVALAEGARRRGLGIVAPVAVVAIAGAALLLAADKSVVLAKRAAQGGYALDPGVRELLPELDAAGQTVRLEAGGAGTALPLELPATYYAIQQATDSNPGIDPLSSDYSTVADFGKSGRGPSGTNPGYELVLTRIGAVESQREVIAESGPYAVERRAHPFDVTVVNGVVADIAERDGTGRAWITGPLAFSVAREPTLGEGESDRRGGGPGGRRAGGHGPGRNRRPRRRRRHDLRPCAGKRRAHRDGAGVRAASGHTASRAVRCRARAGPGTRADCGPGGPWPLPLRLRLGG